MKPRKLAIVFGGDFPEGNTKNARLKIIATELDKYHWKSTFYSAMPYRFSKNTWFTQDKQWNGFAVRYFSISRKYPPYFALRIGQAIVAHTHILWWTFFRAHRYDALFYYNPRWTDTLISLYINSLLGRKVVVNQTELFSSAVNTKWHETEERVIAKRARVLLLISSNLMRHYQRLCKQNTYLMPVIVNTDRFELDIAEKPFLMGYIGSFASKDGIDLLLEGLKHVLPEYPKLMLRLIGHNPHMYPLEQKVMAMGLQNNVEITGTVKYEAIPRLLLECDTLLMNRDASIFSTYGYPIKLGEYFACKKPVIMSDGKGFAEDFEARNQVYKYEVDNAASLADAIRYRYAHVGESNAVAIRGYQYAKDHFDGEKLGLFLYNILKETCKK
jgi:glycosyltransferase involved in cell wall biosynthesis